MESYFSTILELPAGDVDLRRPIDPSLLPFNAAPFGIITAMNPRGRLLPDAENQQRSTRLRTRLERDGYRFVNATGRSPDRSHAEQGCAVLASLPALLEMGRDFEQLAIYWWDGAAMWVYDCETMQGSPCPLST